MFKHHFIKIVLFLFLLPVSAYSQFEEGLAMEDEAEEEQQTQKKEIKPLIKLWYLEGNGAFIDSTKLDTTLNKFRIYNPIYKDNEISISYLGNYGTPYQNNNFFERGSTFDFFFLRNREAYLLTPEKVKYYNTRTPYSLLDFSQSEHRTRQNETRFNVLHTQNINPYMNITFRYDQARSEGQYQHQASKNSFVTLHSNYNKDNLRIHGGFISNSTRNEENGGLTSDDLILSEEDIEYLDVNLNNSQSVFGNFYAYATGEYRIGKGGIRVVETDEEDDEDSDESDVEAGEAVEAGEEENEEDEEIVIEPFRPIVGMIYSFEYQNNKKEFSDLEEASNDFFQHNYYGENYFKDSIRFQKIKNLFQLKQYENPESKTSFGKRAYLGHEINWGSMPGEYVEDPNQFDYPENIFGPQPDNWEMDSMVLRRNIEYSNVFAGGGIFRETGKFWTWNFDGRIYLLGRNAGQTELSGIISKPFTLLGDTATVLSIRGKLENLMPDYFQEEYYSQHIRWDKNLKMEQRMTVGGRFQSPARKLEFGANYALINNYIYNDTAGIPSQTDKELLVLSAYLDKDFNFRDLHLRTSLLWQKASDQQYIHLPEFSAFVSAYYQFVVAKVLFTQIGVDTRYNTAYYADAYNPATSLFHLQDDKKYGDFPYIDAYASIRLKRTRIFFKMMNIGQEFIEQEYFTVPHYPMYRRTYRLGVAWAFYD